MSATAVPATRPRLEWVDAAKGVAIILVVLYHSILLVLEAGVATPWQRTASTLGTFRMPLFFFAAGLFSARILSGSFRLLARLRLARLLWLYVVWTVILFVTLGFVPLAGLGDRSPALLLLSPVWPDPNTWFLWALTVYFAVAWVLRRAPLPVLLVPALALTTLFQSGTWQSGNESLDKAATYFAFFLLASRCGPRLLQLTPHVRLWHALVLVAACAGATALSSKLEAFRIPGVLALVSVLAVSAGCAFTVLLARSHRFGWLVALGRRTLPVYLFHFIPLAIFAAVLQQTGTEPEAIGRLLLPPVLTGAAIAVSLGVHRLSRSVPGLWALPRRWTPSTPDEAAPSPQAAAMPPSPARTPGRAAGPADAREA